ncbi:polyketide synthase dehydratase domain-containing protein, partial [Streptomyces pacificus]|uniref:polyketide synthase dehydratase domain-containing protein n=1 Tax=Streptomyces pacificus TaxID=2705029 RepID=UPI00156363DA
GPGGALSALVAGEGADASAVAVPLLRGDGPEETAVLTALAGLHVRGADIDWTSFYPGGTHIDLPTYPFERHPYWPAATRRRGDVEAVGITAVAHPLLGAAVDVAGSDGHLFTSRISLSTHPWLAGHDVFGRVLLPGTAFLELALRAGDEVGCERVDELTLAAPLVLPERGAVRLQVSVGTVDESGRRAVEVFSRPDGEDVQWTRHAAGFLAIGPSADDFDTTVWPPAGAEPVDVDGAYDAFAEAGFAYGPVFRGLRAAWRRGDEVFAEVALPDGVDAAAFGVHPALLDAALHAGGFFGGTTEVGLPFSWEGVSLHATGAASVRVRLTRTGSTWGIAVADTTGAPVATIGALVTRSVTAEQIGRADRDSLFRLDWVRVAVPDLAGADVVVEHCVGEGGVVGSAHALAVRVLALV